MAQKTNSFERFWKELKRRRVVHVITVYASASFGIIEIVNNLTTPLHLPTSVSTIVTVILAVGFPFAIIVSWLYDLTGGTFERTKPMEETQTKEKVQVPNAWKFATFLSFVVIIGLVVLNIARGGNLIKPGSIQSLVILPFDNETGDEKLDYFVSGMHSSLIADVGKIGSLRVVSKTTSDVYKNARKSLPQIASELKVDAVVEVQVMCIGDSICVQARLVSADRKEKQLWAGNYREDNRKILSLYNQFTKQMADEVKVKLSPEEERSLSRSMIVNREAYDAYMKGNFYSNKLTQNDLETALKYYELAKEKDPKFALAFIGISFVWIARQQLGFASTAEARPKIIEASMKAFELDSTSSEVHSNLGSMYFFAVWNWEKCENEYKKAIKLNPNDATSRMWYSNLLACLGRSEEALRQGKKALNLDPQNVSIHYFYGLELSFAHKYDDAIKSFQNALKIDPANPPTHGDLGIILALSGRYKEALEHWKLGSANDTVIVNAYEKGYNEGGFRGAVLAYNKVIESRFNNSFWSPIESALNYAMVGSIDEAFYWLEQAYKVHDPRLPYLLHPVYDKLHNDPRFKDLCRKMNLPSK